MKAIVIDFSLSKAALTLAGAKLSKSAYYGPLSMVSFRADYPEPKLPGPEWVKVRSVLSGICGSDMRLITLSESMYLYPLTSFPLIPGHEVVGVVEEVGSKAEGVEEGDRVVLDDVLPCRVRGIKDACPSCREGRYSLCYNFDRGVISPGLFTGFCRDTGGAWGEYFVAHHSQLFKVPENVSDDKAVFTEPFSVSLHAALKGILSVPEDGTVAVVGCGMMGIGVITALRTLGFKGEIIGVDIYRFQTETARRFGASKTICLEEGGKTIEGVAELTGGRVYYPPRDKPMFVGGGVDVVFECVGQAQTVDDSLRIAKPGGTVVLVGTAGKLKEVDWAPIFSKELTVKGVIGFGEERVDGESRRAFDLALEMFSSGKVDLSPLLTHKFPLEKYKEALWTALNKNKAKAIKIAFTFS
nr:zinc-binding dehydrogenase [Candidatus Freyrarchaeum guaymaensis]